MQTTHPGRVLRTAVLPRATTRSVAIATNVALVVGFALLTALMAQIRIHLAFTPVPITGQTFAVLLSGAALGSSLGAASQGTYFALGLVFPFYAGGGSGWDVASGATGGYLVGFVAAAWFVGYLAERRQDRSVATAIPALLAGSVIIHLFGVPWLAHIANVGGQRAAELGSYPFIAGDLAKVALAGLALPASWKLVRRLREE